MKKYLFLLLLFITVSFNTQKPEAYDTGEWFKFRIHYGFINAGYATLELKEAVRDNKKVYHAIGKGYTVGMSRFFFKVDDNYESYFDKTTNKPYQFVRKIDEGGYTKKEKYAFKGNTVSSTVKKRKKPETQKTFTIGGSTQDVISLLYKVRTMDFSKFKVGQTQSLMIVFDEKQIPVTLKYMGKETVSAGNLGKKECYKLSISAKTDALKGKDKNLIWLTADANKIPALLKFSIPVGTGQLTLTSASGI